MDRRARVNLLLLAGVILAGWLAWHDAGEEEAAAPPPVPVTALDPAIVARVTIARGSDDQRIELAREAGRWWLHRDGQRLPADEVRVREVLRLADATGATRYPLAEVDAAALGLQPPRAVVTLDGRALRIGAQEPLRYLRYVESAGTVHLVPDTAYVHLAADWTGFVDPAPFAGRGEPTAITAPDWRLARDAEGRWGFTPERPAAAEVARAWSTLQARVVQASTRPGAALALQVEFADGAPGELWAWRGGSAWRLAWAGAPVAYVIDAAGAAALGLD